MSDSWIDTISKRYIELYEKVIGEKFVPQPMTEEATYNVILDAYEKGCKHVITYGKIETHRNFIAPFLADQYYLCFTL